MSSSKGREMVSGPQGEKRENGGGAVNPFRQRKRKEVFWDPLISEESEGEGIILQESFSRSRN